MGLALRKNHKAVRLALAMGEVVQRAGAAFLSSHKKHPSLSLALLVS
jgi:hypothetical protein